MNTGIYSGVKDIFYQVEHLHNSFRTNAKLDSRIISTIDDHLKSIMASALNTLNIISIIDEAQSIDEVQFYLESDSSDMVS